MPPDPREFEYRNGWTAEVRSHVFDMIEALDKRQTLLATASKEAVAAALAAAALAVDKAEVNAEKWRNNANEWRAAMNDRENRFVTKEGHDALVEKVDAGFGRVDSAIGAISNTSAKAEGHSEGISQGAAVLFGVILALMSIAAVIVALVVHH